MIPTERCFSCCSGHTKVQGRGNKMGYYYRPLKLKCCCWVACQVLRDCREVGGLTMWEGKGLQCKSILFLVSCVARCEQKGQWCAQECHNSLLILTCSSDWKHLCQSWCLHVRLSGPFWRPARVVPCPTASVASNNQCRIIYHQRWHHLKGWDNYEQMLAAYCLLESAENVILNTLKYFKAINLQHNLFGWSPEPVQLCWS